MRLYRDAYGVPHVRADDVLDLARGQGYAAAQDRAAQLDHQRRRATGTTAEVGGPDGVAWDVFARRTRMAETARRAHAALSAESRAFVGAFVEGVTAGGVSGWEPWTPLAVFHAQHLLFASLPGKLWHHRARSVLGPEEALLSRDPAYASGSNAWAVGGARTASGKPLIGGDPHRGFEAPGVYAQVRLAVESEGIDVVGFTFPGVPGVQHFAQASEVAWAITNAAADYQDVYAESLDDVVDARTEVVEVRGGEPVEVEVWATARGPLFELDRATGRGLAVRGASGVLGDLGFEALLPLLRSRTVDDVDRALDHWVEPVNNVVIADVHGTVRFRNAGRVPTRPEGHRHGIVTSTDPDGDWTGWVDLPRHDVAADGQVVTANERRGPESDLLGTEFAPPHRAERIAALLTGRTGLTAEDFEAVHGDVLGPPGLRAVFDGLRGRDWDGLMTAESTDAAAYAAWRGALTRRLCAEPVLAPLLDASVHGPVLAPYLDLTASVGVALDRLVEAGTAFGIDVLAHARAALDEAGPTGTWGEVHVLDALGDPVPQVPLAGDVDTVRCTGWLPGLSERSHRGSVARYVWDLADRRSSGWVVPLGTAQDPASPHCRDQVEAWAAARLLPIETDWDALSPTDRS